MIRRATGPIVALVRIALVTEIRNVPTARDHFLQTSSNLLVRVKFESLLLIRGLSASCRDDACWVGFICSSQNIAGAGSILMMTRLLAAGLAPCNLTAQGCSIGSRQCRHRRG